MNELYFENHHVDYIGRNEHKYTLYVAFASDEKKHVIGYIQYSMVGNELHVDHVEVKEELRGRGIGKELYKKLYEYNPDAKYREAGYYTPAGAGIRKWFNDNILTQKKGA